MFKKGFYSHIGANEPIVAGTINLGNTKGRGSSTRMFNYCKTHSTNPSECINQFINVAPPPAPPKPASWSQVGESFNVSGGFIQALTLNANGNIYVGGNIKNTAYCVDIWNGSSWSQLGTDQFQANIFTIFLSSTNNLYQAGAWNYPPEFVDVWNGSSWSFLPTT